MIELQICKAISVGLEQLDLPIAAAASSPKCPLLSSLIARRSPLAADRLCILHLCCCLASLAVVSPLSRLHPPLWPPAASASPLLPPTAAASSALVKEILPKKSTPEMRIFQRFKSQFFAVSSTATLKNVTDRSNMKVYLSSRIFSTKPGGGAHQEGRGKETDGAKTTDDDLGWDVASSWSTGLTKEHFDGEVVGHQITPGGARESVLPQSASTTSKENDYLKALEEENRKSKGFVDGWGERMREMSVLLKQVREPGARGSYLKDSEKAEMYRLHKENPEVYTIERLARDYRIMRQRVHAILWLKELEEEEEKKLGRPLDDSVELLLDTCPEFFKSHDREFHVASLPYRPDFKVMPEGWDGTTRDPDEVHYEISMKEDEMLYQDFVQRMNFNKMKMKGEVKCHKYSRRRPDEGWNIMVEKLGPRGKRGNGGGWKFMSAPDGSSRPLEETEKMYVRRETPRRRRKILP